MGIFEDLSRLPFSRFLRNHRRFLFVQEHGRFPWLHNCRWRKDSVFRQNLTDRLFLNFKIIVNFFSFLNSTIYFYGFMITDVRKIKWNLSFFIYSKSHRLAVSIYVCHTVSYSISVQCILFKFMVRLQPKRTIVTEQVPFE